MTVIIGALPLFIQYGAYIHCTDFAKQQLPFIMETKRMLLSGAPFWSWNTYYGDNFIGSYGFYTLTSPFVWLNCLFPYKYMLSGIFFTLILKYICAFLASSAYLRKMDVSQSNAYIGGLLYAFSSYAISNSFYYHFFEPMIVFPLLLIAIERYIRSERFANTGLIAASFATVFINYYFAVCSFLAALMYVFTRLIFSDIHIKIVQLVRGVILVIFGIIIDAFILLPTAMQLMGGPRTSGGILTGLDYTAFPYFVERLRVLFMPQILEQPTSLFNQTAFNSTSVCLPLFGILGACIYIWKHKTSWITILVVISLIAFLSPVNTVFSLFTNPNYTRWAYALCLFLILPTVKLLDENPNPIKKIYIIPYCIILFSVFAYALYLGKDNTQFDGELKTILLLGYIVVSIVSLISLIIVCKYTHKTVISVLVSFCAVTQMLAFHSIRSDWYFNQVKYTDMKGEIKKYIIDNDFERSFDVMHHRTAFNCRYPNMSMYLNRPGVATSHSVQNNKIRRLINAIDSTNSILRITADPNCNFRSFFALMSVRDYVEYKDSLITDRSSLLNLYMDKDAEGYVSYINNDYIPMGYTYTSYIPETVIDSLNDIKPKQDIPLQLLANLSIPDSLQSIFSKYLKKGNIVSENSIDSVILDRKKICAKDFIGTTTGFKSKISLPKDDVVFYSVPSDDGFTAYIDGTPTTLYSANLGLSAIIVPKGVHVIEFRYIPKGFYLGLILTVLSIILSIIFFFCEKKHKNESLYNNTGL